jgi:hypothetical protein
MHLLGRADTYCEFTHGAITMLQQMPCIHRSLLQQQRVAEGVHLPTSNAFNSAAPPG